MLFFSSARVGCGEGLQESTSTVLLLVFVLLLNLLVDLLLGSGLVQESSIAVICSSTAASRTRTSVASADELTVGKFTRK